MIDLSNKKWDFNSDEEYVIRWLEENGFQGKLKKQFISKTVFEVEKDGVSDTLEIVMGEKNAYDIKEYMKNFAKSFQLKCEVASLREQAKQKGLA